MATSTPRPQYTITAYQPRHKSWPYSASDFTRADPSPDPSFYGPPRFVTHIDDAAIASLTRYYATTLPSTHGSRILDFCSSWVSHYPPSITHAMATSRLHVVGMGMNAAELARNPVLNAGQIVHDLNVDPVIPLAVTRSSSPSGVSEAQNGNGEESQQLLDASTCVVSIDYLIKPVEVLSSLRERTKPGGTVHLAISNRCFPTKVVARWLRVDEDERLQMVGDYLFFAGWRDIEIVDVKSGDDAEPPQGQQGRLAFQQLFNMMGMTGGGGGDPLWVVRARNNGG